MITTRPTMPIQTGSNATGLTFIPALPGMAAAHSSFQMAGPYALRRIESTDAFRMSGRFGSAVPPSDAGTPPASGAAGGGSDDESGGRVSPEAMINAFEEDMPFFQKGSEVDNRIMLDLTQIGSPEGELEYTAGVAERLGLAYYFTSWMDERTILTSMHLLACAVESLCTKADSETSGKSAINPYDALSSITSWAETPYMYPRDKLYDISAEELKLMLNIQFISAKRGHGYVADTGASKDTRHHVSMTVSLLTNCHRLHKSLGQDKEARRASEFLAEFKARHGVSAEERDLVTDNALRKTEHMLKKIIDDEAARTNTFKSLKVILRWMSATYFVFGAQIYTRIGEILREHGLKDMAVELLALAEKHSEFLRRHDILKDA